MTIETSHRGYKITYSENMDEWSCYEAGDGFSAPTLTKLKEKIDRMLLSERRAAAIHCLEINGILPTFVEATLIEYIGPRIERDYYGSKPARLTGHTVAATANRSGSSKASRREMLLSSFAPDTREVHAAICEASVAYQQKVAAEKAYKTAYDAIPRMSVEQIADLVRISGIDPEAKDKLGGK